MTTPNGTPARNASPLCPRGLSALLLLWLLLLPAVASPHSGHGAGEGKGEVGVSERLGEKIPLGIPFQDESGRTVLLSQLVRGPTIILPVYYRCTNVCSSLQWGLAAALPAMRLQPGGDYRVISVSFDDTEQPELAAHAKQLYLTALKTPFPYDGWMFLTGTSGSIGKLTAAAGYRFRRDRQDFIHPVASFVVGGDGRIVRYLYGTSFLSKDLSLALLEAREGKTGASVRKVIGYCFTFDPERRTYVFNILRVSATAVIASAGGFLLFLLLTGRRRRT